jgi:hypothetical protein
MIRDTFWTINAVIGHCIAIKQNKHLRGKSPPSLPKGKVIAQGCMLTPNSKNLKEFYMSILQVSVKPIKILHSNIRPIVSISKRYVYSCVVSWYIF